MTPLLQLVNISFDYEQRRVIEHITLTLRASSCTALIGPNGVGKTTLLRIASGALSPASGDVLIEGKPLATMPRKQRARLIALVPQRLEISFDFTVEQIVAQGRTPYLGLLRGAMPEDRLAVDRALDLADVAHMRTRIFNELSGGERQRVKIAMGLAQQPKLLLLDEPTQNLDIGRQAELIDLLHHLCKQGIAIFASIHDLHLIDRNFSAVHLLGAERPLISGTPEQVLTPFNLAQAFRYDAGRHLLLTERFATQGLL